MSGVGSTGTPVLEPPRRSGAQERKKRRVPVSALRFVGCDSCRMTLAEYDALGDERVEFFDSEAGLAWMVREPATEEHEGPKVMLAALVRDISHVRGSPIRCLGESQLRLLDADGQQVQAIHPDEIVFLHPERRERIGPGYLQVGEEEYPDVVLEVDHTTDVRGNRLKAYEQWGFPEVWVEVPDAYSPSRPRRLQRGLRIYLREGERFVLSPESRAFPGWRAEEIHRALNETVLSDETAAVLARVGRALGQREGTSPDDDPLLRSIAREARGEGHAKGHAEGRARGRAEGRAGLVLGMLASRGIAVSRGFPPHRHRAALAAAPDEAVLSAASSANSESDFFARLGASGHSEPGEAPAGAESP